MATDLLELFDPIVDHSVNNSEHLDDNSLSTTDPEQSLVIPKQSGQTPLTNGHHLIVEEDPVLKDDNTNLQSTPNYSGVVIASAPTPKYLENGTHISERTEEKPPSMDARKLLSLKNSEKSNTKEAEQRSESTTAATAPKKEKLAVKFNSLPKVYNVAQLEEDLEAQGDTKGQEDADLIRSDRGSVRGWTNQVRKNRAAFLGKVAETKLSPRMRKIIEEEAPNEELGIKGKIVIYMTSLTAVRDTYSKSCSLLEIFHNHRVVYKTKDTYLHPKYKKELKERLNNRKVTIPQVFINGAYIGDYKKVVEMNESGQLLSRIIGFEKTDEDEVCTTCNDRGFIMCLWCRGSKKGWKNRFGDLECTVCNKNALQKCPDCSDIFKKAKQKSSTSEE